MRKGEEDEFPIPFISMGRMRNHRKRYEFSIVFIKAPGLVLTAAAVRPSVHLSPLGISIPILAFCPDKEQLPCVKADVI
ncbi:hypothetical protein, partial [Bianquea renquensis]|uniref:hypothetical protein n=1 Tax=Bianquea renquensis TaxID=2763661 RepID=UPI0020164066